MSARPELSRVYGAMDTSTRAKIHRSLTTAGWTYHQGTIDPALQWYTRPEQDHTWTLEISRRNRSSQLNMIGIQLDDHPLTLIDIPPITELLTTVARTQKSIAADFDLQPCTTHPNTIHADQAELELSIA